MIKLEIVVSFQIIVGIAALVDVRVVEFLQLEVRVFAPVLSSRFGLSGERNRIQIAIMTAHQLRKLPAFHTVVTCVRVLSVQLLEHLVIILAGRHHLSGLVEPGTF